MPSIRDFSGGVLNQELQNRDNGNGVLFDCKNVLSSWNGGLRKRTGTRWLKSLDGNSKIIPYRLPDGDDMIMILKDNVIKCYTFDVNNNIIPFVAGSSEVTFPTTGWTSNTQGDWTVASNGENDAYFAVLENQATSYSLSTINSKSVYYVFENTSPVVLYSLKCTWADAFNNAPGITCGDIPIIQYSDDGSNWTSVTTPFTKDITTIELGASNWQTLVSFEITNPTHLEAHNYWRIIFSDVFVYGNGGGGWGSNIELMNFTNIHFSSAPNVIEFNNCPYENDDLDNIRWAQNGSTLTMACKGKSPYQITYSSGVYSDSLFVPSDYSAIWTQQGYPSCVTYYQNRLWFGGFDLHKTRVFGSAFGEFDKFSIPNPIAATSPIMADGTEISNIIENMWGGNNALYCLSADGISMIDAQGAIVATDQVEFKLRNREPVNSMIPTVKDDIMIYLGRDKRKILITDFDFVVQRFKANCISDNYNDFLKAGIKELHYIPRKSSLIYGVLEDGKWFAELFSIDKQKNALYPFETNGWIKDVQPIKKGDETKLLMITQLPSYQYILEEKIAQPDQEIMDFMSEQEKQDYTQSVLNSEECYLDHSIKLSFDVATDTLSNLPYLAGEHIVVIADGQYLGEKTVIANEDTGISEIVLDEPINQAVLGYAYDSYAVLKFVTPYTERKFPKEIAVNFINTGYLEVGNTFDSLKSVLNNLVESVSISNKRILMNGNYAKTLDKHAFETPYVIVRSNKGLPFIITGIDYKVDMSNYQGGV